MIIWIFRSLRSIPFLGIFGAFKLLVASQKSGSYLIKPIGYAHDIGLRGRTSDPELFYNIFCVGGYPVVKMPNILTIVDAGANAGYFSVFAAHHYPGACIISIEPEESNFSLLSSNIRLYPGVIPLRAALWDEEGVVSIDDPSAEKWCFKCTSFITSENKAEKGIQAITVKSIMRDFKLASIDLLKMDIEGGEKQVFNAADSSWLKLIRVLICELHPGCWRSFFDALRPYEYDCRQVGENVVVLLHELSTVSGLLRRPNML
jgi:FkbM family methyltransferase